MLSPLSVCWRKTFQQPSTLKHFLELQILRHRTCFPVVIAVVIVDVVVVLIALETHTQQTLQSHIRILQLALLLSVCLSDCPILLAEICAQSSSVNLLKTKQRYQILTSQLCCANRYPFTVSLLNQFAYIFNSVKFSSLCIPIYVLLEGYLRISIQQQRCAYLRAFW